MSIIVLALATTCMDPWRLLEANRRATQSTARVASVTTAVYDLKAEGLSGTTVAVVDEADGRFRVEDDLGLFRTASGYDGVRSWSRDISGFHVAQDGGDKPALATSAAYRNRDAWWLARAGGAAIRRTGCNTLEIVPRGGSAFEAEFDRASHLLTRIREIQSFGTVIETRYADHARIEGRMRPRRIEITANDVAATRQVLVLKSLAAARARVRFSMPRNNPSDWALPASGRTTVPFRLVNNHVIVDAMVDGRGPFPFLVDTGGHDILTPSTLKALGRVPDGAGFSAGSGTATVGSGYTRVDRLSVGGALLDRQTVYTVDFSPVDVEGLQLGGMIGSEFLERFVVAFDYAARTLTIGDPARFDPRGAGTRVPFTIYGHMPQIEGSFDGTPARFNIDTGSRADVSLTSPFARRIATSGRYPAGVVATDGWGVGGPSRSRVVRAGMLTLGHVAVPRPVAGFSGASSGALSDAAYDGNVGSGILKRFITTFDYARGRMYLRTIDRPDPDTGRFDRTGMWVNLHRDGPTIMDVAEGGPAAMAGLRVGDVITAIGTIEARRAELSDLRRTLKLLPLSEPVRVRYERSGVPSETLLRPRLLIPD